ncbi:mitochondrial ribosomal protein L37-domain-containing protein, partial [Phakopsora pachyrhizi]
VSSIKAGTPLKGLGYIKGVGDPIAKEDHEYPDWLWSLAEPDMGIGRDDSTLRSVKRQLNLENRKSIRKSNFLRAKK